jgi:mono/diheme cytochrome c family protein
MPGDSGDVTVTVDLRGIYGDVHKTLIVATGGEEKKLLLRLHIPDPTTNPGRIANQAIAKIDRQAVFKGTCASCHAEPLVSRGAALYDAACKICHEPTKTRAAMVPSLAGRPPANADYWRSWITAGRDGTLMPAFARDQGGPLTEDQINSLVQFLTSKAEK